ncbi:MAG TPA: hypothetical protein VEA69_16985 [Tepidisphaeraceae bacterium]|nr:hypothetical protein [Tepidisphaeraceae bacterium]
MARKSLTRVAFRPEVTTASEGTFEFDPQRLVSALTFHVQDEGLASTICDTCVQATLRRFNQSGTSVNVAKSRWSGMTNAQRMEWLLASSRTEVYCSADGTAMFREAR